jgi:hypothetical protein
MNPSFTGMAFKSGTMFQDQDVSVRGMISDEFVEIVFGTYFLFVAKGKVWHNGETPIKSGMYACLTTGNLRADNGTKALIIQAKHYDGMRMFGGPVERIGRLKYIDGCTDSLLIPPVKLGDPCLNHLHFPPGINQTMHTHPSIRIGMVYRGEGECVTPWETISLFEGMVFIIHEQNGESHKGHAVGSHCFRTEEKHMDVIAWHPDSDYGPTDEVHPMINRTIVDGVSASQLDEIRTK